MGELVSGVVADCLARFATIGLDSDSVDIHFYSDNDTPPCLFVPPNRVAINLPRCQVSTEFQLKHWVIDVMTSCAVLRAHHKNMGRMNNALIKAVTPRPSLVIHGSPKWIYMRHLLTKDSQ